MTKYCSPTSGREVARSAANGDLVIAFGQHAGRAPSDLPCHYLRWLLRIGGRFLSAELRQIVLHQLRSSEEVEEHSTGMWLASNGRHVAYCDEAGEARLSFGRYFGRTFSEVPSRYLLWMLGTDGQAFLPASLLEIVERVLASRTAEACRSEWPNLAEADVLHWADVARPDVVLSFADHVAMLAVAFRVTVDQRAEESCRKLLARVCIDEDEEV